MGGFFGGSAGGGNTGPANRYKTPARKTADKVVDFIKGGGVIGAVVREVKKGIEQNKERKVNESLLGTSDYQGDVARKPAAPINTGSGDGGNNNQGIELAKTASTEPVTMRVQQAAVDAAPTGPTNVEMPTEESEAERLLKIKRKGRRATILNVPDDELTLSKKVLLG